MKSKWRGSHNISSSCICVYKAWMSWNYVMTNNLSMYRNSSIGRCPERAALFEYHVPTVAEQHSNSLTEIRWSIQISWYRLKHGNCSLICSGVCYVIVRKFCVLGPRGSRSLLALLWRRKEFYQLPGQSLRLSESIYEQATSRGLWFTLPPSVSVSLLWRCPTGRHCNDVITCCFQVPYYELHADSAVVDVFEQVGFGNAKFVVAIGAIASLVVSLLGSMFPMPRVIYAMSRDGLLFA